MEAVFGGFLLCSEGLAGVLAAECFKFGWRDVAEGLARRSWLYQATHSTIASSSCVRVRQTRSVISSVLKVSTKLSAMA